MREWVKPYVLQRTAEDLADSSKDESEKREWMTLKSKMLEDEEILYHELISCLNCHLSRELGEPDEFFYHVFGSVLADLPEKVFKRLCSMKNLFFVHTPNPRAETKVMALKNHITEQKLQVVVFPYDSGFLPSMALRGEIVRELVHVHTGLVDLTEQGDQIELIAREWGFGEEIRAASEHRKEKEAEERPLVLLEERRPVISRTQDSYSLIMRRGETSEEAVYEIKGAITTIGRRPGNDIVLKHPTVSRRHAEICFEGEGYFLYDVASTNGTRVNGRYIHKEKLSEGDIVQIGPFACTFAARMSS